MATRDTFPVTVADGDRLDDGYFNGLGKWTEVFDARFGDCVLSGCAITEQGSPDQTAQMASGSVLINGYIYDISADASISFTAADGSNPRYDLVSVNSAGTVTVTAGTAAASPVIPSLPSDEVALAIVYRNTSDNTINTADITDCRRLIDLPYFGSNYTRGEDATDSYNLKKTITVPAFRCRKYIEIIADLSAYCGNSLDSNPTNPNTTVGIRLATYNQNTTTETIHETKTMNFRVEEYDTVDDGRLAFDESGMLHLFLTADDTIDFTQNIDVRLYLKGDADAFDAGDDLRAINHTFTVKGE